MKYIMFLKRFDVDGPCWQILFETTHIYTGADST